MPGMVSGGFIHTRKSLNLPIIGLSVRQSPVFAYLAGLDRKVLLRPCREAAMENTDIAEIIFFQDVGRL